MSISPNPLVQVRELGVDETFKAADALRALRSHFTSSQSIVDAVDEQRKSGYRLIASFPSAAMSVGDESSKSSGNRAMGVAGFRITTTLHSGKLLYVDDLSTLPEARRQGHAGALFDWIVEEARRCGCSSVQLDSGVIPERMDAHRLYFNKGMRIGSYHFIRNV